MARLTRSLLCCISHPNITWFGLVLIMAGFQSAHIYRLEAQIAELSRHHHQQQQSSSWGRPSEGGGGEQAAGGSMTRGGTFTWNHEEGCQAWPRQHHETPKGLVVTLILTPEDEPSVLFLQELVCQSIPSQLTHLMGPQKLDLLLLIAGGHFKEQLSFDYLSGCLNLAKGQNHPTREWQNLDGTTLATTEYRWEERISVFLSQVDIQFPQYVQNDMSILLRKIEPPHCNMAKSYIQGTRWYSNELLHLAILQEYQWFVKLDLDVFFVKTIEWDLLHDLQTRNSLFAHTAEYPPTSGGDCVGNIVRAMKDFVQSSNRSLTFCDQKNSLLKIDRDFYYTNFIIGRVDFWTQPLVRELGQYLSEYPEGFFTYRWTDQIFWAQALGLLVPLNEAAVTDYTPLRCSPEPNCWMAKWHTQLYEATSECDNDAYFSHTKTNAFDWNRSVTHSGELWQSETEVYPITYKDECQERLSKRQGQCHGWPIRQHHQRPKGLVTTLILTPDDESSKENMMNLACSALPSQLTHLIGPQQWDVLIIIGGNRLHERLSFDFIINCLDLKKAGQDATKVWNNLDGSTLTTTEYVWDNRVSFFLAQTQLEWPQYIQNDMSILERTIEPANICNMPKSYIQGTRWYTHEMLNLAILQEYQWFVKLDHDIFFVKTVEWSILHDLQTRNSIFAHTAEYPPAMGGECSGNIVRAMQDFVRDTKGISSYCDRANPKLKLDRDFYYTNFILGRVDFWTQPTIRQLGRYLSEYPRGFFHYRWTDQIFWAQALGLLTHLDDHAVTDYTELRCSVERNCWPAVFYYYLYGKDSHDVCENGGYFMHTKNKDVDWDRAVSYRGELWQSDTEVRPIGYQDECLYKLSDKQNEVSAKEAARNAKQ